MFSRSAPQPGSSEPSGSSVNNEMQMETDSQSSLSPADSMPLRTSNQSLIDLVQNLDNYKPTLPDPVTLHLMRKAGFNTEDPRILRLVSIASQQFIAGIANDALQHCKMRTALAPGKKGPKDRQYVLTFEDLKPVLQDHGFDVQKPPYFY